MRSEEPAPNAPEEGDPFVLEENAAAAVLAGALDEAEVIVTAMATSSLFTRFEKRDVLDALRFHKGGDHERALVTLDGKSLPLDDVADAIRLRILLAADAAEDEGLAALAALHCITVDDTHKGRVDALLTKADEGGIDLAARLFRIAERVEKESPESALGPLARVLAAQSGAEPDFDAAVHAAQDALEKDPGDVSVWTTLWFALRDQGSAEESKRVGREAIKRFHGDADAEDELRTSFEQEPELTAMLPAPTPTSPVTRSSDPGSIAIWAVASVLVAAVVWLFLRG